MLGTVKQFLAKQARQPTGWFGRVIATRVFDKTNRDLRQFGLQIMEPRQGDRILEIGFGGGRFISALMTRVGEGTVCGIDISRDMVNVASRRNRKWIERGNLELQQASVQHIPYEDGFFDVAYTANTIYFWPNPEQNLREVKRVLAEGGRFLCAMRLKHQMLSMNSVIRENTEIFEHLYTEEEVTRFFEQVGFNNVKVHHDYEQEESAHIVEGVK